MDARRPSLRPRTGFVLLLLLVLAIGPGGLVVAGWWLQRQIRADLRYDAARLRYGLADRVERRAERWFPVTFPVLIEWSRSRDGIRRRYARETILHHGPPFTTWWLEDRLKRDSQDWRAWWPEHLAPNQPMLLDPQTGKLLGDWKTVFGIDEPGKMAATIRLAIASIHPDSTFNLRFLQTVGGPAWLELLAAARRVPKERAGLLLAAFPYDFNGVPVEMAESVRALQAQLAPPPDHVSKVRAALDALVAPTPQVVEALFWSLTQEERRSLLILGGAGSAHKYPALGILTSRILADRRSPDRALVAMILDSHQDVRGRRVLESVVEDNDSRHDERLQAAWYLFEQGDRRGLKLLEAALNGDFSAGLLNEIYPGLAFAEIFPKSRFTRACREYARIRGGTYYGGYRAGFWHRYDPVPKILPPAVEEARWRAWLQAYPGHPGEDDASYWLGRTLQWQGKHTAALVLFADRLRVPGGDGDMRGNFGLQFLRMLDVGTTEHNLQHFLKRNYPLAPFVQYALAVRHARRHDYGQAFALTENLEAKLFDTGLWEHTPFLIKDRYGRIHSLQQGKTWMQQTFRWQRTQWQSLHRELNGMPFTHQKRYLLAQRWAEGDGWKLGYLALYDRRRFGGLFIEDGLVPAEQATNYQRANRNAVAIELLWPLVNDKSAPAELREKSRYRQLALLYRQFHAYPEEETEAMGDLARFSNGVVSDPGLPGQYCKTSCARSRWYVRQSVDLANRLIAEFPGSRFGDDALMILYELSHERSHLERLLREFPGGDRVEEARAALDALEAQQAFR
ncbi:MAG: hypothetical protein KME03_19065 [Aphanocapsa lilacina HA4352-LM1]|jgi:hypothetical protein|nr:hypothetical protein [Aphanocapsa lilacina HA4352-LM1]